MPSTELVDVVGKGANFSMPMGKRSLRNLESVRRYQVKRAADSKRDFPRMMSSKREE